ncbi:MAG: 30S ribosomal protein S6 [Thermodesulfobacteriota bacterium]
MRRYETTYILRPTLGEEQFSEIIERTNKIIKEDGGAVINLERWGTKKLAYEIKKEAFGHYIYFDYAALGSSVHEMERIFRIDDRVLRYLTVKLSDAIDEATIASETERAVATAAARTAKADEAEGEDGEDGEESDDEITDED